MKDQNDERNADYFADMADTPTLKTGFFTGPGIHQRAVQYADVDGVALCEGCIELGTTQEVEDQATTIRADVPEDDPLGGIGGGDPITPDEAAGDADAQMGVGLPGSSKYLWTKGRMPYVVHSNLPNKQRVTDAIAHWESKTGMRFVKRTSSNASSYPNYVQFVRNPGANWSSSQIGMRGGKQLIRVSDAASVGTIVHEIGHAFGLYHEQSRSDRDKYVKINWQNITAGFEGNFQKQLSATDYYGYDYDSIMHYPTWAFSKNGSPTLVPLKAGVSIGQRTDLSYGDRQSIAKMYEKYFKKGYSGVWRQGSGKHALWVNASWSSFIGKWNTWNKQGLRLTDLNVHRTGGQTRYSGVWKPGTGSYALWANASWSSFKKKWQEWNKKGLRLVDINVHRYNGQNRYSGVWLPGTGSYALWVNASWSSFKAKWQEWNKKGLRLVDVHVHRYGGKTRYSGVWLPGTGGYALWANASWSSFLAKWKAWNKQGLRLVDMNQHRSGSSNRYSGAFLKGSGGYYLWSNVTWQSFVAKWQELASKGQRLVDFESLHEGGGLFGDPDSADAASADALPEPVVAEFPEEGFGGLFEGDPSPADAADVTAVTVDTADLAEEPEVEDQGAIVLATAEDPATADAEGEPEGAGGLFESPAITGADVMAAAGVPPSGSADGEDDDGRGVGDAVHAPSGSVPSNPADGDDDDGEGQGDAFLDVGGRDSLLRPS